MIHQLQLNRNTMHEKQFHIVHDGLIVNVHPKGEFSIEEIPKSRLDFVCHMMPGDRLEEYLPLVMAAPQLLATCKTLYQLCIHQMDFPMNSIELIQARQILAQASDYKSTCEGWKGKVDFPPALSLLPT